MGLQYYVVHLLGEWSLVKHLFIILLADHPNLKYQTLIKWTVVYSLIFFLRASLSNSSHLQPIVYKDYV